MNRLALGFLGILVFLGLNAWISFSSVRDLRNSQTWVTHTYEVLREIETDVSLAKDIETGMRGYVITDNPVFLEPYKKAFDKVKNKLEPLYGMTRDDPKQHARVLELADLVGEKLRISQNVTNMVRAGRRDQAVLAVKSGTGKRAMDNIRAKADEMRDVELAKLQARTKALHKSARNAVITFIVSLLTTGGLITLVYTGLTRSKLQEDKLDTAYGELKRLEGMRDSLTAMLVHDLRTPLTTMLGPLEMLQSEQLGKLDELQSEIVGMSLMSSRRLLGLVNELLDISKMEAGEMSVRRETVRPSVVAEESIKHISMTGFDGGARVESEVPSDLPLLQADQELITRVLINLLGNAIKFTPANGKITLGARECKPLDVLPPRLQPAPNQKSEARYSAPAVLFCVRDTGEGIPEIDLDRVFEKFGQVETRQAGRKMSTGLGLTFCRLAVEAHGGIIWVESTVGQGSTFYFTIPLRPVRNTEQESQATAATALPQ